MQSSDPLPIADRGAEQKTSDGDLLKRWDDRPDSIGIGGEGLDPGRLKRGHPAGVAARAANGVPAGEQLSSERSAATAAPDDQTAHSVRGVRAGSRPGIRGRGSFPKLALGVLARPLRLSPRSPPGVGRLEELLEVALVELLLSPL